MDKVTRKPFQGVTNIIRFNWHYYVIALIVIAIGIIAQSFLPASINLFISLILLLATAGIIISLLASWYIYDYSGIYNLKWLDDLNISSDKEIININAGFDETSHLLKEKFPDCSLVVFDFYDSTKHTEISIERARKAYPVYPGTKTISTDYFPLNEKSVDYIFLILAAHEIRNHEERILFFTQLKNALAENGKIIVVEHQRDIYNFMAYNFGFFHFFSTNIWKATFSNAALSTIKTFNLTPFISAFVLTKNGATS